VFPTRDETVAALSRPSSHLRKQLRIATGDWRACKSRGTSGTSTELQPASCRDKPAVKEHFIYATKAKAWRANDVNELQDRIADARRFIDARELIIQDLIPGDGRRQYAYCAFFKEGEAVASMTVRRRRQHPPEFGRASNYVETVESPVPHTISHVRSNHLQGEQHARVQGVLGCPGCKQYDHEPALAVVRF
jgi:D-aspartate ligase